MENKKIIVIIIYLIWMYVSIFVFAMSFHNVDLAINFKGFEDCNQFNCVPMINRYMSGVSGMLFSFGMVIVANSFLVFKWLENFK